MINSLLTTQTFSKLNQNSENRLCFECSAPSPTWASLPNAVFLCLTCAGEHRSLGVNVSFVRSVNMDDWSEKQLQMMLVGGNQRLKDYFRSIGVYGEQYLDRELGWKWRIKGAAYYRETIKAQIEEREYPQQPSIEEALEDDPQIQIIRVGSKQQQRSQEDHKDTSDLNNYSQAQVYSRDISNNDDPVEKVKTFFVNGYQKTAEVTRDAVRKVDEKLNDPNFQNDVQQFKQSVVTKTKVVGEKTQQFAKEGFETIKQNAGLAWGFFKDKYNQAQGIQQPSNQFNENQEQEIVYEFQQPIQSEEKKQVVPMAQVPIEPYVSQTIVPPLQEKKSNLDDSGI